jgi:hypothetical protein
MSEFAQLLIATTKRGDTAGVRRLVEKGADIDQVDEIGRTALLTASLIDHLEIATVLLEQGADVNKPYKPVILSPSILAMPNAWVTPMCVAINGGQLATAQLLSSYGAARAFTIGTGTGTIFITAEELANRLRHANLAAWLVTSCKWTTPLHHLTIIPAARAHALLRKGASILAAAAPGDPTPLSLARELHAKGEAAEGSAAALVLKAAEPWSRATHELFPDAARAYAVRMLLVGHRLSRLPKYETVAQAVFDLWVDHMMPHIFGPRESE